MNSLVSVIVPAYNASNYIEESILSVLAQSYRYLELIVVDDGSTDDTAKIVNFLAEKDLRVKYIYQENSGKPSIARNNGLRASRGEFVAFLDADDLWDECNIESKLDWLNRFSDVSICFSDIDIADENGGLIQNSYNRSKGMLEKFSDYERLTDDIFKLAPSFYAFQLCEPSYVHTSSVLIRKSQFKRGLFDEDLLAGEDVELWLRLMQGEAIIYLNEPKSIYRKHSGSLTAGGNLIEAKGFITCREKVAAQTVGVMEACVMQRLKGLLSNTCADVAYGESTQGKLFSSLHYQIKAFTYQKRWGCLLQIPKTFLRALLRKVSG